MKNMLFENLTISTSRKFPGTKTFGALVSNHISDIHFVADQTYSFPIYLYLENHKGLLSIETHQTKRIFNFTSEFLKALKESLSVEPTPEEIFYYIYAVLYSPTYQKRYEEFLKIDFPRIPLPSDQELFKKLSSLGKELVDLHLLKHPSLDDSGIGISKSGSNAVEKISFNEENQRAYINKERYFEGISKDVWEYRIGAYQVMEKYLKDRKRRKLTLDEINHYMKVAKAIRLTIELQEKIDDVYKSHDL